MRVDDVHKVWRPNLGDGTLESEHTRELFEFVGIGDVRELVVEFQYRFVLYLSELDRLERVDALSRGIAGAHDRTELPFLTLGIGHLPQWFTQRRSEVT